MQLYRAKHIESSHPNWLEVYVHTFSNRGSNQGNHVQPFNMRYQVFLYQCEYPFIGGIKLMINRLPKMAAFFFAT